VKAAHEGDHALLKNKSEAVITDTDAEVFPLCVKTLEVGNLTKSLGGFDMFDHLLDLSQQPGVGDHGQILAEGFAKQGCHVARSSRRNTFLRLQSGDSSPI